MILNTPKIDVEKDDFKGFHIFSNLKKTESTFFDTDLFYFSNITKASISCQKQKYFCSDIRNPIFVGQIIVADELVFTGFAMIILLFVLFIAIFDYPCSMTIVEVNYIDTIIQQKIQFFL